VQVGGQDQLFNILVAGRKLQQGLGQRPMVAIIMGESLPGTDGVIKMSKSQGNHIPLLSEPWDMFGKVMSIPDHAMPIYHKLVLGWPPARLAAWQAELDGGALHPNAAKLGLAHAIVTIYHSPEAADAARQRWDEVFRSKDGDGMPSDMPTEVLAAPERLVDLLRRLGMVESGKEAARLLEQGGVRLDGEVVAERDHVVTLVRLPVVVQVGKRRFVRLIADKR
jgi:tyrosyl-tRNA synthetase